MISGRERQARLEGEVRRLQSCKVILAGCSRLAQVQTTSCFVPGKPKPYFRSRHH